MNHTGQRFEQGQHICSFYDTADEQVAVAVAYLAEGLRKGERCLYVADSETGLERLRNDLRRSEGIDAVLAATSGALILLTSDRAHLAGGTFDSERMLKMLNDAVEEALNDGFTGLRTCGDMSWLLDRPAGYGDIVEYEAVLNQFFQNVRALGMCQYDRNRLPVDLLSQAGISAHSSIVIEGKHTQNPFFRRDPRAARCDPETVATQLDHLRRY